MAKICLLLLSLTTAFNIDVQARSFDKRVAENREDRYQEFAANRDVSLITLKFYSANGSSDECVLHFLNEATADYDWMYDALKMESIVATAAECGLVSQNGYTLSIDSRPFSNQELVVPVFIDMPVQSNYTLEVFEVQNLPFGFCAQIEDSFTGELIPVEAGQSFELNTQGPFTGNRFIVKFVNAFDFGVTQPVCEGDPVGVISSSFDDALWSFSIYDLGGELITTDEAIGEIELPVGGYVIEWNGISGQCAAMSEGFEIALANPMSLLTELIQPDQCNAAQNGAFECMVQNAGEFNFSLLNSSGNLILSGTGENGALLFENLTADIYNLEIDAFCGATSAVIDVRDPSALIAEILQNELFIDLPASQLVMIEVEQETSEDAQLQWFLNEELISEDEIFAYAISQPGIYSLELLASNGTCEASDSIMLYVSTQTGVSEFANEESIAVMYSEESVFFLLNGSSAESLHCDIFDLNGKLVWQMNAPMRQGNQIETSISNFPRGIYMVRCTLGTEVVYNGKIISGLGIK